MGLFGCESAEPRTASLPPQWLCTSRCCCRLHHRRSCSCFWKIDCTCWRASRRAPFAHCSYVCLVPRQSKRVQLQLSIGKMAHRARLDDFCLLLLGIHHGGGLVLDDLDHQSPSQDRINRHIVFVGRQFWKCLSGFTWERSASHF